MDFKKIRISGILFICFILFTILVKNVDRKPVGPEGSLVGLAGINGLIFRNVGTSNMWYGLSTFFGVLVILLVIGFACLGAYQLIRTRNFLEVDPDIYALAIIYVIMAVLYIIFDKAVIINYRPVLEDGKLAASYPSSHTLMAVTVVGTAIIALYKRLRDERLRTVVCVALFVIMLLAVLTRTLSGYHWLTDILGGALLGAALVALYAALAEYSFEFRNKLRAPKNK
ncbi:MAG: phosphatase PAP2 family protein [Lachnospiraceae bacterium]|nr:phosphatase PAP2 family protein [Lachnospiraceae bacterium]